MMFVIIAVVVVLGIWIIGIYNGLVKSRMQTKESWSQIDVQLKRRNDLIPNLIETVKGYAAHEQSTFDAVVAARAKSTSASTVADVAAADGAALAGHGLCGAGRGRLSHRADDARPHSRPRGDHPGHYAPSREVEVKAGENRGVVLDYRNVVLAAERVAEWDGRAPLRITVSPDTRHGDDFPGDTRHAILAQELGRGDPRSASGPILAAIRLD